MFCKASQIDLVAASSLGKLRVFTILRSRALMLSMALVRVNHLESPISACSVGVLQTAIAFSLSGNRQGEHVPITALTASFQTTPTLAQHRCESA
jgi:hypothetical protein